MSLYIQKGKGLCIPQLVAVFLQSNWLCILQLLWWHLCGICYCRLWSCGGTGYCGGILRSLVALLAQYGGIIEWIWVFELVWSLFWLYDLIWALFGDWWIVGSSIRALWVPYTLTSHLSDSGVLYLSWDNDQLSLLGDQMNYSAVIQSVSYWGTTIDVTW